MKKSGKNEEICLFSKFAFLALTAVCIPVYLPELQQENEKQIINDFGSWSRSVSFWFDSFG
ncbi:MAG: hypothetical protein AYK18_02060 [Theionarchaea archaeon DG-70]|nr:MAG: hypothetical protein AYK18_02060 [Theionarchaea archaeon DG-70]